MRKFTMLTAALVAALALAVPTIGADWVDKGFVTAADRMLTTMPADFYQMDPDGVKRLMETAKPLVIDVREKSEWDTERIAGAVHIPIRDLAKVLDRLPDSKGAPIVTYCAVGVRGSIALTVLRMWGYTNVRNMKGGLGAWKTAGHAVTK